MDFYNKTILLYNFTNLLELLNNKEIIDIRDKFECNYYYGNRIAIKHYNKLNKHTIRIWKTKSLLDIWYNDFNCKEFLGALDYTIDDNEIKINYLNVNKTGNNDMYMYSNYLEEYDTEELINALIYYIKLIGKKENKEKIILDVHGNLIYFNLYYYYNGFNVTNRKCKDNPYWIETEFIL
jgi:hypothetical protein